MKKATIILACCLVAMLAVGIIIPSAFAVETPPEENKTAQLIDLNKEGRYWTENPDGSTYCIYQSDALSYCAQVTPYGTMIFSYIADDEKRPVSSEIYEIADIYTKYGIDAANDKNYEALTQVIISNLDDFEYSGD